MPYVLEKINMRCYGSKVSGRGREGGRGARARARPLTPPPPPQPASFTNLVPSGLLPVIEMDGRVVTESTVIMDLIEHSFPDHAPLVPTDPAAASRHAALLRLERRLFGDWLDWLCRGGGGRAAFWTTLSAVDAAIGDTGGPYMMGPDLTLADVAYAPWLERMVASIGYFKGELVRGTGDRPHLDAWFAAMEARPAYIALKSDAYTHAHDLPPQLGGCVAVPTEARAAAAAALDGADGRAWRLPLAAPLATGPIDFWPGEDPPADRLRAAARLVANREAIARFAARGSAPPGAPRVSAPLADPNASADVEALPAVDAALRAVAHALLEGRDEVRVETAASGLDAARAAACLAYMCDRVGVPRDLPLPAARQLRAHLNAFIDAVAAE